MSLSADVVGDYWLPARNRSASGSSCNRGPPARTPAPSTTPAPAASLCDAACQARIQQLVVDAVRIITAAPVTTEHFTATTEASPPLSTITVTDSSASGAETQPLSYAGPAVGSTAILSEPVTVPTILIWFSEHCGACKRSERTFRALEGNRDGYRVLRIEATPDRVQRLQNHLLALPQYDFLYHSPGLPATSNALGLPNTIVHSVRNNNPTELQNMVPSVSLAAEG